MATPDAGVAVSVVIPTVRQRFLAATLDSLARQRAAPPFEVLVIENGRRGGDTEALVAGHAARGGPPMRYHFLDRAGANPARNAGAALARGAIVALTDDDCAVAEDWIAAIHRAHEAWPTAGCIGGPVDLEFLVPPPAWLVGVFRLMLAGIDWPPQPEDGGPTTDITHLTDRYLVSANLSYRPAVAARIGGFCEDLVPPDRESRNDEALFLDGARRLGAPGLLFDRRVRVRHRIPAERLTPDYFERKFRHLAAAVVAYHRRARLYAAVAPPFASEAEALANTLLQHEMATGVTERQIAEARRLIGDDPAAKRAFVRHLLRCRIAWFDGLQAGIAAADG